MLLPDQILDFIDIYNLDKFSYPYISYYYSTSTSYFWHKILIHIIIHYDYCSGKWVLQRDFSYGDIYLCVTSPYEKL